ncbi:hypothetical protein [Gordonia sputi]|uniref:hypothetical protein n=1 Tax=Gordonia sputi TaxID=36823 RepID=UPI00226E6C6C|nr:hypothetical protein [Gordonia sputi]
MAIRIEVRDLALRRLARWAAISSIAAQREHDPTAKFVYEEGGLQDALIEAVEALSEAEASGKNVAAARRDLDSVLTNWWYPVHGKDGLTHESDSAAKKEAVIADHGRSDGFSELLMDRLLPHVFEDAILNVHALETYGTPSDLESSEPELLTENSQNTANDHEKIGDLAQIVAFSALRDAVEFRVLWYTHLAHVDGTSWSQIAEAQGRMNGNSALKDYTRRTAILRAEIRKRGRPPR